MSLLLSTQSRLFGLIIGITVLWTIESLLPLFHSREQIETDSNYSNIFSIWDRIFGTYKATVDFSHLRYGLDGFDDREKQTVPALLKLPFLHET